MSVIQPSQDVLDAAHDAEREIWNLSTYAGTSPDDRVKIIAEFFAGFEKSPKPPAEWMGEAAKEIIEDLLDSEMQTWSVVGPTVIEIIQRHAPKVPEGFKLMPVPQEMTKTDIDGWRRNHELGKLLAAVKELK